MDKQAILKQIPLFENISDESREALADICLTKTVRKKEILFFEGDKGLSVYILVRGNIQLYKATPDGRETVIKVVKPGEMFAEVILFEKTAYPVNAVALTDGTLFMISRHQFTCLLEDRAFRDDFFRNLMQKLRFLADQIRQLTQHDVEERLFMFLEEQFGREEEIPMTLSKKDVAAAVGATPETLSRLLNRLKQEGKLTWEDRRISIDRAAWRQYRTQT